MILLLLADLHVRSDRLDTARELFGATLKKAQEVGSQVVLLLGDILHEKTGHSIECLVMVHDELKKFRKAGVNVFWLRGNHEVPIASRPHLTIMTLFDGVCQTVIKPQIFKLDGVSLFFLPWYPAHDFLKWSRGMAVEARKDPSPMKLLLAHVGLNEGHPSPSNMRITAGVSVNDLFPKEYTLALLGDYHHHQWLLPNAAYLGCPISHIHGDDSQNSVWALDTVSREITTLPLEGAFSRHVTWEPKVADEILEGYREIDFNRIKCHRDIAPSLRNRYPSRNTTFETFGDPVERRLAVAKRIDSLDMGVLEILKIYLKSKSWGEEHYALAAKALEEAQAKLK